ncbi:MAG: DUF4389 domain-containing protein [Gammaproteobacteria bacterium]
MDQKLKEKLSAQCKWLRLLYMVFFLIVAVIVKFIMWFLTAFQFLIVLFTDHPNKVLLEFSEGLSIYIAQIFRFLTYNTDSKPFPFTSWPTGASIAEVKPVSVENVQSCVAPKKRGRKPKGTNNA